MRIGDVLHVKSITVVSPQAAITYRARKAQGRPKKGGPTETFSVLLLGKDSLEEPLDPCEALSALGWAPMEVDDE